MGWQIIKQPTGELAIFSSGTDTLIAWNGTPDEIVKIFVDEAAKRAERDVRRTIEHVLADQPGQAYHQFAMSWEEAISNDEEHGGEAWEEFRAE